MRLIRNLLILTILTSCGVQKNQNINDANNRKDILGREFSNSEVLSIDILEIEHPLLGGVIETNKLSENEKENFLRDFDHLKKKGIYKCKANYVIRLYMESDTMRLKVCGTMVANRMNDLYYELDNGKSIIEDYL